jgi:hypothetical protein
LFKVLQRRFQMAEQTLKVWHTAAASDKSEIQAVRAACHSDVERLSV